MNKFKQNTYLLIVRDIRTNEVFITTKTQQIEQPYGKRIILQACLRDRTAYALKKLLRSTFTHFNDELAQIIEDIKITGRFYAPSTDISTDS